MTKTKLKLRNKLDWLWSEVRRHRKIGNEDVAVHFEEVALEGEKLYLDYCALVIANPKINEDEMAKKLSDLASGKINSID